MLYLRNQQHAMMRVIDYRKTLQGVPQFANFPESSLESILGCCYIRTVKKGGVVTQPGPVDDLIIILRGRLAGSVQKSAHDRVEYGSGETVEAFTFFSKRETGTSLIALRDSQLLYLGYEELVALCMHDATLIESLLNRIASLPAPEIESHPAPTRIALCPAGRTGVLDTTLIDVLSAAFERFGEVRTLTARSFGLGLPGGITLSSPETDHTLQEQDLAFDMTLTVADPAHNEFARTAVEEADEVILVAAGKAAGLNEIEAHAFHSRGSKRCHLLCISDDAKGTASTRSWEKLRECRSTGSASLHDEDAIARFVAGIMDGNRGDQ